MEGFEVAAGSVPGTLHTKPGQPGWKNNQDSFALLSTETHTIAVVTDGCGSGMYSEVGARLGSQIVCNALHELLENEEFASNPTWVPTLLQQVETRLIGDLRVVGLMLGGERVFIPTLYQHLLFTVMGAVVTPEWTAIFSYGDGVFALNGNTTVIGEFENNMPPYPAYRLVPGAVDDALLGFRVQAQIATSELESLLIGSDGVAELIAASTDVIPILGTDVGPLAQFWEDPSYTMNPDKIRRRLAVINCERLVEGKLRHGPLSDDTTCAVIRRTNEGR